MKLHKEGSCTCSPKGTNGDAFIEELIEAEEKIPSAADRLKAERGVPTCQEGLTSLFSDKTDTH